MLSTLRPALSLTAGCQWPTTWRQSVAQQSAYYHLRQIRPTLQSLSRDAANTLVQAFICSRLDYWNSVLYGVTDNQLQRLQSAQNAAARLITRTGRREHISPVLQELHWLPVRRRVDFKLATLMFKSLHGCAPSYLSDACKSAPEASRRLRSSGAITCVIPWSQTRLGNRSFDVAGPADCVFGTSCLLHCGHLTVSANSEYSWKHFCLSRTRLRRLMTLAFRCQI